MYIREKYKKVKIRQNTEVKKINNFKDHVKILYKNTMDKKNYEVNSRYLVGCDGAKSITRKQPFYDHTRKYECWDKMSGHCNIKANFTGYNKGNVNDAENLLYVRVTENT